jgi:hypothetical protein
LGKAGNLVTHVDHPTLKQGEDCRLVLDDENLGHARASANDPRENEPTEAMHALDKREREAMTAMVLMPASNGDAVLCKLEAVESMLVWSYRVGVPRYPSAIMAVASIRADLLALDIA